MATYRWVVLSLFIVSVPSAGGESGQLTRHEIGLQLKVASPSYIEETQHVQFQPTPLAEKKSVALAALYSLLLPGMGEVYTGAFPASGKYFLIAEGALWLTFATFEIYGNALRDDSRTLAVVQAGINPAGKNDQFFIDIGNFSNTFEYNEEQLRNREIRRLYDPAAGFSWQWSSEAARQEYKDQRLAGESLFNGEKFIVGAIIVNHVLSAINAGRTAVLHNKAVDQEFGGLEVKAGVLGGFGSAHGIELSFVHRF